MFVEVTAQIAAKHTVADESKVTFTSETWTDVRQAIALRRSNEIALGSWHSHPARFWCSKCPEERQRACALGAGFMSADDRALHRTIFPRAFSVALVVTNALAGLHTTAFGWRLGAIEPRGFFLVTGKS